MINTDFYNLNKSYPNWRESSSNGMCAGRTRAWFAANIKESKPRPKYSLVPKLIGSI